VNSRERIWQIPKGGTVKIPRTRNILIASAVAFMLLVGGAAAGAAIAGPVDGNGVIHACYKSPVPAHGTRLVVINAGAVCPRGTAEVNWQQAGGDGMISVRVDKIVPYGQPTGSDVVGVLTCPSGYVAVSGGYGPNGSTTGYVQEDWTAEQDLGGPAIGHPQSWQITLLEMGTPYTGGGSFTESFFANCIPTGA
jgi:hypothetical protein